MVAETGVCTECGAICQLEPAYLYRMPGTWIDPDRQDSENEGARCPGNDGRAHEVVREPVCQSCGDQPMGCSRCTDADGDTR